MKSILLSTLAIIALVPAFAHADSPSPIATDDIGCVSYVRGNRSTSLEEKQRVAGLAINYVLIPDAKGSDIGIGVRQLVHENGYSVETLLLATDTQSDEQLASLSAQGTICLKGIPSQVEGQFYVISAESPSATSATH